MLNKKLLNRDSSLIWKLSKKNCMEISLSSCILKSSSLSYLKYFTTLSILVNSKAGFLKLAMIIFISFSSNSTRFFFKMMFSILFILLYKIKSSPFVSMPYCDFNGSTCLSQSWGKWSFYGVSSDGFLNSITKVIFP